jgi:hypothetical protein
MPRARSSPEATSACETSWISRMSVGVAGATSPRPVERAARRNSAIGRLMPRATANAASPPARIESRMPLPNASSERQAPASTCSFGMPSASDQPLSGRRVNAV